MARDPPDQGVDILQMAFVLAAGITMVLMVAGLFVSGTGYFVLLSLSFISVVVLTVCFLVCADRLPEHDGEDVEAPRGVASHGTQRNQRRPCIQLPAVALAQLRQLPAAEVVGDGDCAAGGRDDEECVVCLGMVGGDGLPTRKLAACRHVFHKHCIEQWLRAHPTCPICRCNARQESLEVIVRLNT